MDWSFVLSCWGAIVSTILGMIKVLESFHSARHAILVDVRLDPLEILKIRVTNIASRPITIVSLGVVYGPSATSRKPFFTFKIPPKRLVEAETFDLEITRPQLIVAARQHSVQQQLRCRLHVFVETSSGRRFTSVLYVPHNIITEEHEETAREWIAADLFLGFEQMGSEEPFVVFHK